MEKEKLVIGIIGEKGSGKETIGDLLINYFADKKETVVRIRSSDILAETLTLWGLTVDRHNLQQLAIIMNGGYGHETLSTATKNRIALTKVDIVLFDGVRWESDVTLVRSFRKNFLIYVTADPRIRYERTKARKQKIGEESTTFEQFMEDEKVATEIYIPEFGKTADAKIVNNTGLDQLAGEIKRVLTYIPI